YYWRCLERQPVSLERVLQAQDIYRHYPFSEDRSLALARSAAPFDTRLAGKILKHVVEQTRFYFFALRCAEDALEYGQSPVAKQACGRVLELLQSTTPPKRFAPVSYTVPGRQLMPAEARQRAEALLASITTARPHERARQSLAGLVTRFLRRSA